MGMIKYFKYFMSPKVAMQMGEVFLKIELSYFCCLFHFAIMIKLNFVILLAVEKVSLRDLKF